MNRRTFLMSTALVAGGTKLGLPGRTAEAGTIALGDDQVQVVLEYGPQGLTERDYQVRGRLLRGLKGNLWTVDVEGTTLSPAGAAVTLVNQEGTPLRHSATFRGETDAIAWELSYGVSGPGRITKSLRLRPMRSGHLSRVVLWNGECPSAPLIARTKIQDIAAFYRQGELGLFASLDFPYSNITSAATLTSVSYPPHEVLIPGSEYRSHSLIFGAVQLTGRQDHGFDEGEVEAMDALRPRTSETPF
jgi:hypothetical protein